MEKVEGSMAIIIKEASLKKMSKIYGAVKTENINRGNTLHHRTTYISYTFFDLRVCFI
jgi:hypothetical protein